MIVRLAIRPHRRPASLPLPFRIPPERVGESVVPLPAPRGPFGEVDAPPEVRETACSRDHVDRGRNRNQRQAAVHADRGTVLREDRPPERSQVVEPLTSEKNSRARDRGREARTDPPGLHPSA